jgi:hypothetical protein
VLEKLNVWLKTLPGLLLLEAPWTSQTPKNTTEFTSQSTLVLNKFTNLPNNLLTTPADVFKTLIKGTQLMAH